jgi:hypothetical protein
MTFPGFSLEGKIALVTGAGRGFGLEIATALATAGALVLANGRSPEGPERAVALITAAGGSAVPCLFDIADEAAGKMGQSTALSVVQRYTVEPRHAGNALQRPLRSRFRARLTPSVRPPKEKTRAAMWSSGERCWGNKEPQRHIVYACRPIASCNCAVPG